MYVNRKTKQLAQQSMLLALTMLCFFLASVLESNTLFFLAAASFFVGLVAGSSGLAAGGTLALAAVLLGMLLAPNKLYVATYAAMAVYLLFREAGSRYLCARRAKQAAREALKNGEGRSLPNGERGRKDMVISFIYRMLIFDLIFAPAVLFLPELLINGGLQGTGKLVAFLVGQVGWLVYELAYGVVTDWVKKRWGRK